jgi:hypothetical protein
MVGYCFERETIGPFRFSESASLMMGLALIKERLDGY